jgi:hypothetical protein
MDQGVPHRELANQGATARRKPLTEARCDETPWLANCF